MQKDRPQSTTPWVVVPSMANLFSSPNHPRWSPTKERTASEILAYFSPKDQSKKSLSPQSSPDTVSIAMTTTRGLRNKGQVSYEISSDSDNPSSLSRNDSAFSSPEKPVRTRKRISIVDLDDDEDEFEEIEPPGTPPPRVSAAGHSLRQHGDLHLSLRAQENGDKRVAKKRKLNKHTSKKSKIILHSEAPAPRTARNEIRDYINVETGGKRARFFVDNKDVFLPLLPEGNHVQRLVAQRKDGDAELSVPYEVLEKQPAG
jgi:hypothetical protein